LRGSIREEGSISSGNFFVPLLIGAEKQSEKRIIYKYIKNIIFYIFTSLNYNYIDSDLKLKYNNLDSKINNNKNINVNDNFNSYLAGLFEGDGHVTISRGNNQSKNKIPRIRKVIIGLTFNIKDLPLCEHLKFKLQEG
jgi:hypothetical protein